MNTLYLLVVGSRGFLDYNLLKDTLDNIRDKNNNISIVSGGAAGADSLAERYANENNIPIEIFRANWNKYGRSAGYIRNEEMHKYISTKENRMCIAFWDGQSRGTQHNFSLAKKYSNPIMLIRV